MRISPASSVTISDDVARELGLVGQTAGSVFKVDPNLANGYATALEASGSLTNPGAAATICELTALTAGHYEVRFQFVGSNATSLLVLQHTDSADAVQESIRGKGAANILNQALMFMNVATNDKIKVRMIATDTGLFEGYISARRLLAA